MTGIRTTSEVPFASALAELTFAVDDVDARSLRVLARVIDTESAADLMEIRGAASRALVAVRKLQFWFENGPRGEAAGILEYPRLVAPRTLIRED